jgi:phosphonate transport system permease protein
MPRLINLIGILLLTYMAVKSFIDAEISLTDLYDGLPYMYQMLCDMLPPKLERAFCDRILTALEQTFQMALAGTILGILASLPLSVCASRRHSPHPIIYAMTRGLLSFIRSVPDLVWALIFVVGVGLGAFAGTLALMVDTMAFCGRFFAEALEETSKQPEEALQAIGAGKVSTLFCATLPSALPSLINTGLYSLEKATRASVVLGLVGAGGIGKELKASMEMFRFSEAATIIISIFLLVVAVEYVSTTVRKKIMG